MHFSDASFCTCHFLQGRSAIGDLQYPHRSTVHFDRPCLGTSALECCVSVSLGFFFFLLQISHRFIYLFFLFRDISSILRQIVAIFSPYLLNKRENHIESTIATTRRPSLLFIDFARKLVARGSCTELIPRRRTR